MANTLKMDKQEAICDLLALGWSHRRIGDKLRIHRRTVKRYTDSRFDQAQEVVPGVFEERYVESPRWSGVAQLNYLNEELFDVFLGVVYTGPMIAVNEVDGFLNRDTGHFFVVDLSLKKHIALGSDEDAPHLDITLGVRNLFDERQDDLTSGPNRDAGYFYGPRFPRSYFLTASYHF